MISADPLRWGGALALLGAWLTMCLALWRVHRPSRPPVARNADWLVAYASQTGSAQHLARQSVALLASSGLAARAACISTLDRDQLRGARRVLFIASTYGEGDAPDNAARFAGVTMDGNPDLSHLRYGVLALGDSSYANFCGFGRALDGWLAACGAGALFERVEVDRGAPAPITAWQRQLCRLAGTSDVPDWEAPAYGNWCIAARTLQNPGSSAEPLYRLTLVPLDGALPEWESGDLAQVCVPSDPDHPREYSIASIPAEGHLELLVRLRRRPDGTPGAASNWLCQQASAQDTIALRLRAHERFRLGINVDRPLIAIGAGSGLAGLRAHLKARIDAGVTDNWLLFGERSAAHDFICRDELTGWRDAGMLAHLDLAFSRAPSSPRYVQHLLREQGDELRRWIARGAAVYVCGSLQGMAEGVDEALRDILDSATLDAMTESGRYRRDVY